jgi:O-antigen/teichoic acid export membrane protein
MNSIFLGLNVLAYKYFGLTGLGISFFLIFIINIVVVYFLVRFNFEFRFEKNLIVISLIQFALLSAFFIISIIPNIGALNYIFGLLFTSLSVLYTYKELNKRINILQITQS